MRAGLVRYAAEVGLSESVIWEDGQDDMAAVYNALDVTVSSSSFGEGFSNVLAEAMACGVVCVATDVGDARRILGETGLVVPPDDSQALAFALADMLRRPAAQRRSLGELARARIETCFSMNRLVEDTLNALLTITKHRPASTA
jgi:glycosyltransferase involved in cell wall biosynthesis